MTTVIYKVAELMLLVLLGFVCSKIGLTGKEFNKYASPVLANLLIPCTVLKSLLGVQSTVSNGTVFYILALYLVMFGVAYLTGKLLSVTLPAEREDRGVLLCITMYTNVAMVGFPLVEALYGTPEAMLYAGLSVMPFNAIFYSAGMVSLRGEMSLDLKKILNIPLVTTAIGIFLFVTKIPLPGVVSTAISSVAGATVPMSMIILGTSLGQMPFGDIFRDKRIYVVSFVRLIINPLIVFFILKLFVDDPVIVGVITVLAATPTAVLVPPFCIQFEKNEAMASTGVFMTTLLSALTMPLMIWLLL